MVGIKIKYHTKKVETLCTDYKKAKKELPSNVAEKLFSLINLLESAETLSDIHNMNIYHLHVLKGDREGEYALDIAGRKSGYRLIIIPLDDKGNKWETKDTSIIYQSTEIIIIWEVSKHYD